MDPSPLAPPPDEALREYYHLHFAGRPRITRNVTLLGQLIVLAERNGNAALSALWHKERALIEQEQQQAGTLGRQLAQRMEDGQIVHHRLRRLQWHAQQLHPHAIDRQALAQVHKDAAALMAEVLPLGQQDAELHARARAVAENLGACEAASQTLDHEARRARTEGDDLSRAQVCVRAAQLLQETFDSRIGGLPGTVVRPERITALAEGLQQVASDLAACAIDGADHGANCQALRQQAGHWRAQAQRAAALRRQHTPDELAHALGQGADAILEEAHAWPDASPSAQQAVATGLALCDRMDEVRRQLEGVPLIFGLTEHHHTLSTVSDALAYLSAKLEQLVAPPSGA
jgi:hypothetical protein